MNENRLTTAAKNIDLIAKLCRGISSTLSIVCIVFAALVLFFGEKMFDMSSFSLDMKYIKVYLADEVLPSFGLLKIFFTILLTSLSAICFVVSYGIKQLREILAPMKEGRPFEASVPGCIRKIAWSILAGGGVYALVSFVESMILTKAYPIEQILSSSVIESIEYTYTTDFGFVYIFAAVMFLSYIFEYGQKLQRESDETL